MRPGPIQGGMVHPYLRRARRGSRRLSRARNLRRCSHRTLGVPIFQEQVMQIAIVAAGFTPGEAGCAAPCDGRMEEERRPGPLANGCGRDAGPRLPGTIRRAHLPADARDSASTASRSVSWARPGLWMRAPGNGCGSMMSWPAGPSSTTFACDSSLRLQRRRVMAAVASGVKPVWRLRTACGHSITATAEHSFLTSGGWCPLGKLEIGSFVASARSLHSQELAQLAASDIDWDRVVSIEKLGDEETSDLQIEGTITSWRTTSSFITRTR